MILADTSLWIDHLRGGGELAAWLDRGEVLSMISRERLHGLGLGYVDAALLASVRLSAGAALRTRDRRLQRAADRLAAGRA